VGKSFEKPVFSGGGVTENQWKGVIENLPTPNTEIADLKKRVWN